MTPYAPPLDADALRAMYPERDGKPMSDNTKQGRWIHLLYGNLCALFADRADTFVASDNLWYPVEGKPEERQAPDVYVAFGRPKGDRGSYMQWLEDDVPLTVVFEILSPGNTKEEMVRKFDFYDHHGVEEYYIYDPDTNKLLIYTRGLATLRRERDIANFVSPRLGIHFEMSAPEMTIYGPKGVRFRPFEEERRNAKRLAELSRKARCGQGTPEEIAELERLEQELS